MKNDCFNSYGALINAIKEVADGYEVIGLSELGYEIFAFKKGKSGAPVAIFAATHAREHITAKLCAELFAAYNGERAVWLVPVLNPDGYLLARGELTSFLPQPRWKANIKGVDINTNFGAGWGNGAGNLTLPANAGYIGTAPFSAKECTAARDFLLKREYSAVLTYHSLGEEIYYGFNESTLGKDIAELLGGYLSYCVKTSVGSAGGLKDYAVTLGIPAVTIEVGNDKLGHPYPEDYLPSLVRLHSGSWEMLAAMLNYQ